MDREKRSVVIVGGGAGGSLLAKSLQHHAHVLLIDPKEYFEITWACLRATVEPSFARRSVVDHKDYVPKARILTSTATGVTRDEVMTVRGDSIPYDYLVIATGHTESVPETRTQRLGHYQDVAKKIESSISILIVGGGPTGVELAGEIAVDFPDKKVTLVHRGSRLLEFIGPKASRIALAWLTSKKVEVILGQSVDLNSASDGIYTTSGGESIAADCHFVCTGTPLGSSWLKGTYLHDSLDDRGRLIVDKHLRVKGHKNIFAIGDITDIPEMKQGYIAQMHARVTAKNIRLLLAENEESRMVTYSPGSGIALVTLGRINAVAQFPFMTISGCIPRMIKSKDLFVGKTRRELGLKPSSA